MTIPEERWQLQPPVGSRWTYADEGGVLNGVRKARLKRFSKHGGATIGYTVDLLVQGVDLSAADLASLTVTISVRQVIDVLAVDEVVQWQGARTCRGAYPKLTCK